MLTPDLIGMNATEADLGNLYTVLQIIVNVTWLLHNAVVCTCMVVYMEFASGEFSRLTLKAM